MRSGIAKLLIPLLFLPLVSTAQNEIQRERNTLQGINSLGFAINIEVSASLNDKEGLEITSIEDAARKALKEAQIPLVSDETVTSAEIPLLYMHINTMDAGRGLVPFSVSIDLYQPVNLVLNRERRTSASTWQTGTVGIVSYDRMNIIQESAVELLQDFIDDYRRSNN